LAQEHGAFKTAAQKSPRPVEFIASVAASARADGTADRLRPELAPAIGIGFGNDSSGEAPGEQVGLCFCVSRGVPDCTLAGLIKATGSGRRIEIA